MKPKPRTLVKAAAFGALLALSGCAVWRMGQTAALVKQSEPLRRAPADADFRLLVVGDSTAVGTGASSPEHSVAGLIAARYPRIGVDNRARNGARWADTASQLASPTRYDMVLVQAGGNDVMRLGSMDPVGDDIASVARRAREIAPLVVLMPCGNVGNAPFFFPPLSWWMTARSRVLHRQVAAAAAASGAVYVNLFQEAADDPFAHDRALNASDGLHPSDDGYALWFDQLVAQAALGPRLARATTEARSLRALP